jgi:selenocysteine lyase/cysteine desulfurase
VTLSIAEARALFAPTGTYLDSATYGLPPAPVRERLAAVLGEWRDGTGDWVEWSGAAERARATFARLVGVEPADVAIGATVSELVGLVAASLPDGAQVLVAEGDFSSVPMPFAVHAARGVRVTPVPLERLVDAVGPDTTLVAVSAVQSAGGAVCDLDALSAAAQEQGAVVLVDGSQACGWLPLDASRIDFLVSAGYKWLLSPRGTAFLTVRRSRLDAIPALAAGWYSGEDPYASFYYRGDGPQQARDVRRLDSSPAWFSWVGADPALQVIEAVGVETIRAYDVALANRCRAGLGLEPSGSAIVGLDAPGADQRLARAGIKVSQRAGRIRAAFHLYNDEADVDRLLEAVRPA